MLPGQACSVWPEAAVAQLPGAAHGFWGALGLRSSQVDVAALLAPPPPP